MKLGTSMVAGIVALALIGCDDQRPSTEAARAGTTPSTAAAPGPGQAQKLGQYTLADSTVELVDSMVIRNKDGLVAVLLTPTTLSAEDRKAVLERPDFPGMALHNKTSPGHPGRYPYVLVEMRLSGPPAPANVEGFYVMAYGIEEANLTDNINGFPDEVNRVQQLSVDGDQVRLVFTGQSEISGKPRSWSFDVGA